ncbi:MAG TPA: hypothetical protein VN797_09855, partial [Gemmatimonadaceae bacterium]|nr:hypothetical protein [Gemmatimonadaceae bacterium]
MSAILLCATAGFAEEHEAAPLSSSRDRPAVAVVPDVREQQGPEPRAAPVSDLGAATPLAAPAELRAAVARHS